MKKQVKAIPFEIKEIKEEERSFLAVASTEDIDRDNDRIMSSGWDLGNFLKNPVVPWAHRYGEPPVAKATEISVQDGKLMFRPKFATKEEYDFADTIFNLYKGGYLRSFSVGFMPKRYEIVERGEKGRRGYDFLEQELWEISACTVPSNPNALVAAKAKGLINDGDLERLQEEIPLDPPLEKGEGEADPADETGNNGEKASVEERLDDLEGEIRNTLNKVLEELSTIKEPEEPADEAGEEETASEILATDNTEEEPAVAEAMAGRPEDLNEEEVKELAEIVAGIVTKILKKSAREIIDYHRGIVK